MIQPVILAAGKGTRMKSELPKVAHRLGGQSLIHLLVDAVNKAGLPDPIIVVGYNAEEIKKLFTEGRYKFVKQHELSGTASAVREALPYCNDAEKILVLYGDQPLIRPQTLKKFVEAASNSLFVIGTTTVENFSEWRAGFAHYGRILREDGVITNVVEYKNATEEQRASKEVNVGICRIDTELLVTLLPMIKANTLTGEYYLTDLVSLAHNAGIKIATVDMRASEAFGVNSPEELAHAEQLLQNRK